MNGVGYGPFSTILTWVTDSVPLFMNPPVIAAANILFNSITITWSAITLATQTGGAAITYYGVECNMGSGWANLTTPSVGVTLSYVQTTPTAFVNNTVFQYRCFAMNGVGSGAYSTITSITTLGTPARMNAPTLSGTVYYNSITITWLPITSSADTGGSPVTYYYVDFFNRPCYASDAYNCSAESYSLGSWTGLTDPSFGT